MLLALLGLVCIVSEEGEKKAAGIQTTIQISSKHFFQEMHVFRASTVRLTPTPDTLSKSRCPE